MVVVLRFATVLAHVVFSAIPPDGTSGNSKGTGSSPWCKNESAPAVPSMYGAGPDIDLSGPRGKFGQFIDIPDDQQVISLFRQGLSQLVGFNCKEALRCFSSAVRLAPDCAVCHWGVAMSLAPNINYHVESQAKLNAAAELAGDVAAQQPSLQPKTHRLVAGVVALIQDPSWPDNSSSPARTKFMHTMCAPMSPTPTVDPDLDALCAAGLMNLSPWNYYEGTASGGDFPLRTWLQPAKDKLQAAQVDDGGVPHPFAIHLLIHLLEPSNAPSDFRWQALQAASALYSTNHSELVPAQGHLTHMPAHLFLRVGQYYSGVLTSQKAIENDQWYLSRCLTPYGYGHNLKMLVANARFAGMMGAALQAARLSTEDSAGQELTPNNAQGCVDCAGAGSPELSLTYTRFGKWSDVLAQPLPPAWGVARFQAFNEAAYHYARATALYASGPSPVTVAQADQAAAAAISASSGDPTYRIIVPAELCAVRAWRVDRNATAAVRALEEVVAANDALPYMEPPRWYYPPRQCLGFLLLAAQPPVRNVSRALAAFSADLENFPENGWSLFGAAKALGMMPGQQAAAAEYKERALVAWQNADEPLLSPCPQLSG